jgi:hypothetical protein
MFFLFRSDRRRRMPLTVLIYGNSDQNHQRDEGNNSLFLRGEDEKIHGTGLTT